GILSPDGALVIQGALLLAGGGYMDLPASFSSVNPFDGSGDFTIEMDFMSDTGGIFISSAREPFEPWGEGEPDTYTGTHSMSVYMWAEPTEGEVIYDNFWVGAAGVWGEDHNPGDGDWHNLRVAYDADGGGLITAEWWEGPESEWNYDEWGDPEEEWDDEGTTFVGGEIQLPEEEWYEAGLVEVTLLDGQDEPWEGLLSPDIPDIHLDTVSLGRSLNEEFPYEELPDPAEWAIGLDNVRIYNHYIPEPATVILLGLGGLGLLRRRRN
ncbi:MAG: PEP-CTERM sorting domain-containing protein, partial [Planctomycetota bacterium]